MVLCWKESEERARMEGEVALGVVIRGKEVLETLVWVGLVVVR